MSKPLVAMDPSGLRVEFEGRRGPTQVVVPLVFHPGEHRDVRIRVCPRPGVSLRNEVIVGDTLRATFSRSHSTSAGGSFFATGSHTRTFGRAEQAYEVVSLPDFRGVLFRLDRYDVNDEPVGLQLAFPIATCDLSTDADYFAEVSLEIRNLVIETFRVPREVHSKAGRVLLLNGCSNEFHTKVFGTNLRYSHIAGTQLPFLQITELKLFDLDDVEHLLKLGFHGIHLYTNVDSHGILVNGRSVSPPEFFSKVDGFGLKFIYIDTCNSVEVVSSFRRTDIGALVAATQILLADYANEFESRFYHDLGNGTFISQAFQHAASAHLRGKVEAFFDPTRSGAYDPMFLDLRRDFSFGEPETPG